MVINNGSKLSSRIFICNFLEENKGIKRSEAVNQLKTFGYKERTISRVYHRYVNNLEVDMARKQNDKQVLRKKEITRLLMKNIRNQPFRSYRYLGLKVGCDHKTVKKYLKELGIVSKSRKIVPRVSIKQKKVQNIRLKSFVSEFLQKNSEPSIIVDDETYFTIEGSKWVDKYYYEQEGCKLTKTSEFIEKSKFPLKIMMWIAISENGISQPYFFKGISSINSDIYSNKCLPKLKNYINKSHRNDNILFWPDLASCHTSETTKSALKFLQIKYLPKEHNPPNCPQIRPIEKFWAYLKRHVYSEGIEYDSLDQLIRRIRYLLKTLDFSDFQLAMKNLPRKIRKAQKEGLNSTF